MLFLDSISQKTQRLGCRKNRLAHDTVVVKVSRKWDPERIAEAFAHFGNAFHTSLVLGSIPVTEPVDLMAQCRVCPMHTILPVS